MSKSNCGCYEPKCGCDSTLHTPTPFITQATCNTGCETLHPADCVEENKWISVTETDYVGSNFSSSTGINTLFKIEKLKYRKTRSRLELQGRLESTGNFTPTINVQEFLFLNASFLNKIGFATISNTLQMKYMVVKDNLLFNISDYTSGYIVIKQGGVYYIHNYNGISTGSKININLVFDNNYDL